MSLRPADRGAVYYWDWYWRYPWCRPFFDERIERVTGNYQDPTAILEDPQHSLHAKLSDELNYATLVQLAPNFSAWFGMCEDQREDA